MGITFVQCTLKSLYFSKKVNTVLLKSSKKCFFCQKVKGIPLKIAKKKLFCETIRPFFFILGQKPKKKEKTPFFIFPLRLGVVVFNLIHIVCKKSVPSNHFERCLKSKIRSSKSRHLGKFFFS